MNVVFVDTETLGLEPDLHPIWEVALIGEHGEQVWQLPVSERDLALAQKEALEIGRFQERYGSVPCATVKGFCANLVRLTEGKHLVGAVVSFDEERLRRLCWKHGYQPKWRYHNVDVEAFAAGKLGMQPPWDSDELSARFGVHVTEVERHTALGDARWAKRLYEAVLG